MIAGFDLAPLHIARARHPGSSWGPSATGAAAGMAATRPTGWTAIRGRPRWIRVNQAHTNRVWAGGSAFSTAMSSYFHPLFLGEEGGYFEKHPLQPQLLISPYPAP